MNSWESGTLLPPPGSQELDAQISCDDIKQKGFKEFVRQAWHLIEPSTPLVWNWHFDAICEHLEAVTHGIFHRLIINVPPGSGKSSITSVLWPVWVWTMFPEKRFLFASHREALALRDSVRRRNVIQSEWFQERWALPLSGDVNMKSEFHNAHTGYMVSLGTGGSTGLRGDFLVLDDPNNSTEMESEVQRESVLLWLDQQWSSRGNKGFREVVIQQRTHTQDVTGHMLTQGGCEHLKIAMRFADEIQHATGLKNHDPRTKTGELMWPEVHDEARVALLSRRLGPYGTSGQLQQEPAPSEGGIFRRAWFRPYHKNEDVISADGELFNLKNCFRFMTCDPATSKLELKNQNDPDYFAIGTWVVLQTQRGPAVFLLDVVNERLEGQDQETKICAVSDFWNPAIIGVETIGYQLNLFQRLIRGVQKPDGTRKAYPVREMSSKLDAFYRIDKDKMARAYAATPLMADGRFYVPEYAPWLGEYLKQLTVYPNAEHDDMIDITSAAVAIAMKIGPQDAPPPPKPTDATVQTTNAVQGVYGTARSANPLKSW